MKPSIVTPPPKEAKQMSFDTLLQPMGTANYLQKDNEKIDFFSITQSIKYIGSKKDLLNNIIVLSLKYQNKIK